MVDQCVRLGMALVVIGLISAGMLHFAMHNDTSAPAAYDGLTYRH